MKRLNDLNGSDWIKHSISWFSLQSKARDKSILQHPATFPPELPARFIKLMTRKNGWVLDPFMGSGSTAVASRSLVRNCMGIELDPKYVALANSRTAGPNILHKDSKQTTICGNSVNIDKILSLQGQMFDLVVTSPPYWNILKKSRGGSTSDHKTRKEKNLPLYYSNDENDLGNIEDYKIYLSLLADVFIKMKPYINTNGYIVIILQNVIGEHRKFYPIAWDLYTILKRYYEPRQEQIWCITNKKGKIWGFPSKYVSSTTHRYCLVFEKVN